MANPIQVLADDELAVLQYLRAQPLITALVPATSITTQLAPSPTYPAVIVQRMGGERSTTPQWIDVSALQVDVLGPSDRAACKQLALTVRACLIAIANDRVSAGVLVSAAEEVAPQWLPDTLSNPPLPRFSSRYRVVLHP